MKLMLHEKNIDYLTSYIHIDTKYNTHTHLKAHKMPNPFLRTIKFENAWVTSKLLSLRKNGKKIKIMEAMLVQ